MLQTAGVSQRVPKQMRVLGKKNWLLRIMTTYRVFDLLHQNVGMCHLLTGSLEGISPRESFGLHCGSTERKRR